MGSDHEADDRSAPAAPVDPPDGFWQTELTLSASTKKANKIRTTKYTFLNYIPKTLFEQFSKLANVYFLVCAVLVSIPSITPLKPFTSIFPLVMVVVASAGKEWWEDYKRSRSDSAVNTARTASVLIDGAWEPRPWETIDRGQIVRVYKGEDFPADMLVLSTPDTGTGKCFVETARLDGETNLKPKSAPAGLREALDEVALKALVGSWKIKHEPPNQELYRLDGFIIKHDASAEDAQRRVTIDNVVLRGCSLRNTEYINGIVLFTGMDTKTMQNSSDPRFKKSTLERQVNRAILYVFFFQLSLCVLAGIISVSSFERFPWYLGTEGVGDRGFILFFTYFILMNTLIPISLMVSIEIVKVVATTFIDCDIKMFDEASNMAPRARTSNLSDELGQIQCVLSDKTGTLTLNDMRVHRVSVGPEFFILGGRKDNAESVSKLHMRREGNLFDDERISSGAASDERAGSGAEALFLSMAVCHTVQASKSESGEIEYQSSSPDEGAFVSASQKAGFELIERTPENIKLKIRTNESEGEEVKSFEVVDVLEFDSDRKMMSIVIKEKGTEEDSCWIYTKGADERIAGIVNDDSKRCWDDLLNAIQRVSAEGLRALVFARRKVDKSELGRFTKAMTAAHECIDKPRKAELLTEAHALLECRLELVGMTACEDRLQDGVFDTITSLRQAGMGVWMLTGDKRITAIAIGKASGLLSQEDAVSEFSRNSFGEIDKDVIERQLDAVLREIEAPDRSSAGARGLSSNSIKAKRQPCLPENVFNAFEYCQSQLWWGGEERRKSHGGSKKRTSLVVEGDELHVCLHSSPSVRSRFLRLVKRCKVVICCRMTPKQKCEIVELMKNDAGLRCLAIGDGSNDVSMIQAANVGVGIAGVEGGEAVMAADYGIGQFKFLKRLLLVHGQSAYRRLCTGILYFFYKNCAWTLTFFWFACYSGFAGQPLYDESYIAFFNVIFTSAPVLAFMLLEQELRLGTMIENPGTYLDGSFCHSFNNSSFFVNSMCKGFLHSIIVFFVCAFTMSDVTGSSIFADGKSSGIWSVSTTCYSCIILTVTAEILLQSRYITRVLVFCCVASVLLWFGTVYLMHANLDTGIASEFFSSEKMWNVVQTMSSSAHFWLVLLLVPVCCIVPTFGIKALLFNGTDPNAGDMFARLWPFHSRWTHICQFELEGRPKEIRRDWEDTKKSFMMRLGANTTKFIGAKGEKRPVVEGSGEDRPGSVRRLGRSISSWILDKKDTNGGGPTLGAPETMRSTRAVDYRSSYMESSAPEDQGNKYMHEKFHISAANSDEAEDWQRQREKDRSRSERMRASESNPGGGGLSLIDIERKKAGAAKTKSTSALGKLGGV